jgi:glycosyltransferase involved in cell wall biosynthesis
MDDMRIAYIVHRFPPEGVGGTEIYTWNLARAVAAAGHQVHIFYPSADIEEPQQIERDGLHIRRVPRPTRQHGADPATQFWHEFRHAGIEKEFRRFLNDVRPDLVHFQHVQWVSARLIALAHEVPRVVTLHDYWYFCANGQLIRPDDEICPGPAWGWRCVDCGAARAAMLWLRALRPLVAIPFAARNLYLRHLLRSVDRLIAPSRFLRDQYASEGLPAERIDVIGHGLDHSRLASGAKELPPPSGHPHFGYLGSIAHPKGVHVLIEAFNTLPPGAALTIYGDPQRFPEYTARLRALVRHPGIRFAGALDYASIGDALRQLDYLVVPSIWYESYVLVAQEAMGMKVPVVASRLGALIERVKDGKTGRLFEPGDVADLARVLRDLIEHPELCNRYRASIPPVPTMAEHVQRVLDVYDEIIRRSRIGPSHTILPRRNVG